MAIKRSLSQLVEDLQVPNCQHVPAMPQRTLTAENGSFWKSCHTCKKHALKQGTRLMELQTQTVHTEIMSCRNSSELLLHCFQKPKLNKSPSTPASSTEFRKAYFPLHPDLSSKQSQRECDLPQSCTHDPVGCNGLAKN